MKNLIFGCVLMLCGMIGGTGWLIARTSIVEGGAWSTVFNVFDFGDPECYMILLLYAVAVVGTFIAIRALKEDR